MNLTDIQEAVAGKHDAAFVEKEYPDVVPGRVAHIDADFLAYMASYERADEVNTLDDILYRARVMIDDKRREAGAEKAVLHLTPSDSNKGGRYDVAIQKKYQGQRDNDRKPQYLGATRDFMGALAEATVEGVLWHDAEADDGMAEAGWKAHRDGDHNRCVIVTKDKDLRMVPGLHLEWDTGELHHVTDTFGEIGIVERVGKGGKITKKHKGWGTKFFWFQMLMGDTADSIKGCPKAWINGKHKQCGLVGAYELLKDAKDDRECFKIVTAAYKSNIYKHWMTGEEASWSDVFWSEACMLWMRRNPADQWDVKKWLKEALYD